MRLSTQWDKSWSESVQQTLVTFMTKRGTWEMEPALTALQCAAHGVAKSPTRLSDWTERNMSRRAPSKRNTCHLAVTRLQSLYMVNPEEMLRKQDYRRPDGWGTDQGNHFNKPWLFNLHIHNLRCFHNLRCCLLGLKQSKSRLLDPLQRGTKRRHINTKQQWETPPEREIW